MRTRKIIITGMVQGIGYRPFVAQLAESMKIKGNVYNSSGIVVVMATATDDILDRFVARLKKQAPYGARIDMIEQQEMELQKFDSFFIIKSRAFELDAYEGNDKQNSDSMPPLIPPDLAICPDCERELFEKGNRREGYPLISCVKCGPRYSIIEKLPYDRNRTTMDDFKMCPDCYQEYTQKGNLRRHAQTISCHSCGPQLTLMVYEVDHAESMNRNNSNITKNIKNVIQIQENISYKYEAFQNAVHILKQDGILAIKDIGGFHLACQPFHSQTIARLRSIKGREKKPFAIMFASIEQIRNYCHVNGQEEKLLRSNARPIVLLKKKTDEFAENVCGTSPDIGAMLPCNPLQIMLLKECGPLIMTSANRSGQPIITKNEKMCNWMMMAIQDRDKGSEQKKFAGNVASELLQMDDTYGVLMHERRIITPIDDSVMRVVSGRTQVLRRARGMVPEPIIIKEKAKSAIFAAGGDLKSVFCNLVGNRAYLSQHIGDLESVEMNEWYHNLVEHMNSLFGFQPKQYACDLHPDYYTVRELQSRISMERNTAINQQANQQADYQANHQANHYVYYQVQHHHAHIASVIAEHGLQGKTLGIAFDGTGYGPDHTIWGSEFLLCEDDAYQRMAHLQKVELIGGNQGAKDCELILYGYLASLGVSGELIAQWMNHDNTALKKYEVVSAAVRTGINTVTSTSMGRLFDAVSALLHICKYNQYEGEAAIELENVACMASSDGENEYEPIQINVIETENSYISDSKKLMEDILRAYLKGEPVALIAFDFIRAIADFIVTVSDRIYNEMQMKNDNAFDQIALSGGTFQNRLLLEQTIDKLERKKYTVFINEQVPTGDGGICLGQAYATMKKAKNKATNQ